MSVIYFLIIDNNIDFNYVCYIYFEFFCHNYKIFYTFITTKQLCVRWQVFAYSFKTICAYWVLLPTTSKRLVYIDKYCIGGEIQNIKHENVLISNWVWFLCLQYVIIFINGHRKKRSHIEAGNLPRSIYCNL